MSAMRRVALTSVGAAAAAAMTTTTSATAVVVPRRSVYTTWADIPREPQFCKESWLRRITSQSSYRSFDFWHVPEVTPPAHLHFNSVETYLLSCIEDDTRRLLNVGWGYDFDPFWHDRVNSHVTLYTILYQDHYPVLRYIFGSCAHKTNEMAYMERKLNYLRSVLYWAAMTERRFTALTKARYYVQRVVWNALERERYLCACVEAVDSFRRKVPEEFREKAMAELELKLVNMRHWIWDCPNGKRTYTRLLA